MLYSQILTSLSLAKIVKIIVVSANRMEKLLFVPSVTMVTNTMTRLRHVNESLAPENTSMK